MNLGNSVQIHVKVSVCNDSLSFYKKLGYQPITEDNNCLQLTDGTTTFLLLQSDHIPANGLTYITEDIETLTAELESLGICFTMRTAQEAIFTDPNGCAIRLTTAQVTPPFAPAGTPLSTCGRFGELSIETDDYEATIAFWQRLGFQIYFQPDDLELPFIGLTDGKIKIGIYKKGICQHRFRTPAITYFEPDMAERITRLKQAGIPFTEEIPSASGIVNEAITEAPDGQMLFLFYHNP